ncbi:MAG: SPOR domain-containing protein [Dysgonamonadaceae bacterium]|jgi:hypothetical protein|nr:SPOR domain-containing protein [Dysgonamonadaceae bacterium]
MKKKVNFILVLCFAGCCICTAQSGIVEELQRQVDGEGAVRISADASIMALVGKPAEIETGNDGGKAVMADGFRILVYIGNDPKTAKNEAAYREAQIRDLLPEIRTYIRYEAPNFKVFAGDFLTRETAVDRMRQMKTLFPEFGREMYVTHDKIDILTVQQHGTE